MGRLRKDYLTRQRSTPFQCLAYTFTYRRYLFGRGVLLAGCSWQVGKGSNHPVTADLQPPGATTSQLGQYHCLFPHSFPQSLPSEAGRSFNHVSTRSHRLILWHTIWSLPMLLSCKQPCQGSRAQKYRSWPVFLLAIYWLSFSCWHLPCCLKRWAAAPFASHSVKIRIDGDFKEVSVMMWKFLPDAPSEPSKCAIKYSKCTIKFTKCQPVVRWFVIFVLMFFS